MSRATRVVVAALLGACGAAPGAWAGEWQRGRVTAVKSGEVVAFAGSGADWDVRLVGLAAPAPGQPFADEARAFLTQRVLGREVRLRVVGGREGGEIVAHVLEGPDGKQTDVGVEMVAAGLAWRLPEARYKPLVKGQPDPLTAADQAAREARRGIWSQPDPVAPWTYRGEAPPREARGKVESDVPAGMPGPSVDLTPGTDRNTAQKSGDDNECAIAKNPVNSSQLFVLCNTNVAGQFAARSTDGGATWIYPDPTDKTITDGDPGQGPAACCDPTLAWDKFGNLFISYIDSGVSNIVTILSTDGGATFSNLASFSGSVDQPTVTQATVGANVNLWVVWNQGSMVARGAQVTGLGAVGAFNALQTAPGTSGCSFGDIAVSPTGAVVQVCESPSGGQGPANILMNVDADGLGAGGWSAVSTATATNVGGFDFIPAQSSRSVDAEAGLAYDANPSSPRFGRLYLVYSEEPTNENNDLNTMVRYSDNNGTTWSAPIKVNDDATTRSQFLPKIASDPATGNVAVCWHDARNSAGNTAMQVYCSATGTAPATPTFAANVLVGDGGSTSNGSGVEFGDYSGLTFGADVIHPVWADTSNSGGTNPNGTANFDAYTDRVTGPPFPVKLESIAIE